MPAVRRRPSKQQEDFYDDNASMPSQGMEKNDFLFAPNVTATSFKTSRHVPIPDNSTTPDSDMVEFEDDSLESRQITHHGRKKPANHIPRPPNAFILFRSSFIKGRHVSTGVETNHSTLSKIIGLTWQNLPEEERQKWHARAKIALDEHRRRFPQYTFRPIHGKKGKALEKKKPREVGPKDEKRCAKIAELLVCGKKGQELEDAIQEFDKYHVPEIITRFEEPITASAFSSSASETELNSVSSSRKSSGLGSRRLSCRTSISSCGSSPSPRPRVPSLVSEPIGTPPLTPCEENSFTSSYVAPPFDFDTFPVDDPTSVLPSEGCDNFTQAVSSAVNSFNLMPSRHALHLSVNTCYPGMEDWSRHRSPSSNSPSSIPSTPAQINLHFPEVYGTFPSEASTGFAPVSLDASYCQYSSYPYAIIPDQACGVKNVEDVHRPYPPFCTTSASAPITQEDLGFSSLMESLNSYSL